MVVQADPAAQPSDAHLVARARDGEVAAFGLLYDRYAADLFRFVYAHVGDRLDAEDLTAETFLRAWDSMPKYRERGYPFSAYLYRVARNLLVDHYRKSGKTRNLDELQLDLLSEATPLSQEIEKRQQAQKLQRGLLALRPDYRSVLILRFINGLSPEIVAGIMGRSPGALRVLQHRALSALRRWLEDREE